MSVDTKYGEAIFKQTQEVAEMFKAAMPKITTNKNGYEIRTKVLEMAKDNVWSDYHAKFAGWSTLVTKEGRSCNQSRDARSSRRRPSTRSG